MRPDEAYGLGPGNAPSHGQASVRTRRKRRGVGDDVKIVDGDRSRFTVDNFSDAEDVQRNIGLASGENHQNRKREWSYTIDGWPKIRSDISGAERVEVESDCGLAKDAVRQRQSARKSCSPSLAACFTGILASAWKVPDKTERSRHSDRFRHGHRKALDGFPAGIGRDVPAGRREAQDRKECIFW